MGFDIIRRVRQWLSPPHPTFQSRASRNRVLDFLNEEQKRAPKGFRLNLGSGSQRIDLKVINLDLFIGKGVDIQGDILHLPLKNETVETIVCTGVLEHVSDPVKAVEQIYDVLKWGREKYF